MKTAYIPMAKQYLMIYEFKIFLKIIFFKNSSDFCVSNNLR